MMGARDYIAVWTQMIRIRAFEEVVRDAYLSGEIPGSGHSYLGEEAIAAAMGAVLDERDRVVSTYRGHGHSIARGADLKRLMAEVLLRGDGYQDGRGGSMHAAAVDRGVLGATAIVGAGSPIAVGAAYAQQALKTGGVTAVFFGDGASDRGTQHEAMNLAALWRLPIVFVVENNEFAFYTSRERHQTVHDIAERAAAYRIRGIVADGNDMVEAVRAAQQAVDACRSGAGPVLLEYKTWRHMGHYIDDPAPYKDPEEQRRWLDERDPVVNGRLYLKANGVSERELARIEHAVRCEVDEAAAFARAAAAPDASSAANGVYGDADEHVADPWVPAASAPERACPVADGPAGGREIRFGKAVREAITSEMERDSRVFIAGEDVTWGGVAKQYWGLAERFPERVRDTPISETAIVGLGLGSALSGMRSVLEFNLMDFTLVAMDEFVNEMAKWRYLYGMGASVTAVAACGLGEGSAAQHSQSLEALFCHVPGLKVVYPSDPRDAKGLMASAIRDPDPVLFLYDLRLQDVRGDVPEESFAIPLGRARTVRHGRDVTLVGYGSAVFVAVQAAEELAQEGIEAEVLDLRSLVPLDLDAVLASVRRTGRALVVHGATRFCGFGAEVAALIAERAFDALKAPVARLGAPWCPVPAAPELKASHCVGAHDIEERVRELVRGSWS